MLQETGGMILVQDKIYWYRGQETGKAFKFSEKKATDLRLEFCRDGNLRVEVARILA